MKSSVTWQRTKDKDVREISKTNNVPHSPSFTHPPPPLHPPIQREEESAPQSQLGG